MQSTSQMFESVDTVLAWATRQSLEFGTPVAPRGKPTYELYGVSFGLSNPRSRIPTSKARKWSLPLALGEFCWHFRGSADLETLAYYAPRWRDFSDDGRTVEGSCYGRTAFSSVGGASQWEHAKSLLQQDPYTRRALLIFDEPRVSDSATLDKSCLTSIQFLLRENRLHAVVTMRSNDLYLGVPYDVFNFTMLQELMAVELGVELGTYIHFAGSLHLYERDIQRARQAYLGAKSDPSPMPPMPSIDAVRIFVGAEAAIRENRPVNWEALDPFWIPFAKELAEFKQRKALQQVH